jgi:hypothetical protein
MRLTGVLRNPALAIYPTFEGDSALGQSGYQKNNILTQYDIKNSNALPKNYNETNVTGELLANCDADGDGVPDFSSCESIPMTTGDNHRGYLGYIDNATKLITNDGAINVAGIINSIINANQNYINFKSNYYIYKTRISF